MSALNSSRTSHEVDNFPTPSSREFHQTLSQCSALPSLPASWPTPPRSPRAPLCSAPRWFPATVRYVFLRFLAQTGDVRSRHKTSVVLRQFRFARVGLQWLPQCRSCVAKDSVGALFCREREHLPALSVWNNFSQDWACSYLYPQFTMALVIGFRLFLFSPSRHEQTFP